MTTVSDADGTETEDLYFDRVEALSRATVRRRFDPHVDIDWDAPENALADDDPRWQLDPESAPLAATDWYAQQPLQRRIDMGRWVTANTLKVTLQFEMMLIRGVVHYAGKLPNRSPVFQYLLHELIDECNHIQMFQEFVNRTGEDVPGMRRGSRVIGPILGFIGGYANIIHFIGVLCGEQPLHFQQTLQHRGAAHVPPLLNKITYIHLAEEARHISFADDLLAQRMQRVTRLKRAWYAILFPFFLRWLIGEMIAPPRTFARQFGVPRQVFKSAFWRSARSRQMMAESAADVRRVAEDLGLRTAWSRWIWRMLGIEGRLPRYRGEPDRGLALPRVAELRTSVMARLMGVAVMAGVALLVAPDGPKIIACAAAGAGVWAAYHTWRERRGGVVGNQPFEWPRLFVWIAVCVAMIPAGGLIGLALVVFMILALAEFMPTM
ncbi:MULTISPECIES: diiron oxygenase [Mycolicibacterium]|uniref:AurF N-oxygenase family protein n=1 Tax=Mycolicibacterium TaxID=1866885 RepID=UPI0007ECBF56|nr:MULTISPECIES: diiron oxygenase [Mycolicibacterium]MCA4722441.1 diiron oxygenase [Mycolicibacterium fortuitum]NOP96366.1 diiron oxygenase [Mycolicibacterium fortuitum]OBK06577.1 aminobenzoate oxygenase [Mycolicibacterium fortuitum]OMC06762.1 aminobenzoate oxygenase [Mycolicibacterium fortuitum]